MPGIVRSMLKTKKKQVFGKVIQVVGVILLLLAVSLYFIVKSLFSDDGKLASCTSAEVIFVSFLFLLFALILFFWDFISKKINFLIKKYGKTVYFNILLSLFVFILLFSVPEGFTRVRDRLVDSECLFSEFFPKLKDEMYIDHPYLIKVPRPNFSRLNIPHRNFNPTSFNFNSLGYRGKEFNLTKGKNIIRIVALGGSTTWGDGATNDSTTYPAILEEILNDKFETLTIEVINAGVPGYNSAESFINLVFRASKIEPDIVLVYHTHNDLKPATFPGCKGDYACWRGEKGKSNNKKWWEYSRFFTWLKGIDNKDLFEKESTIGQEGITEFKRNIINIHDFAESNGIDVVLSTSAKLSAKTFVPLSDK